MLETLKCANKRSPSDLAEIYAGFTRQGCDHSSADYTEAGPLVAICCCAAQVGLSICSWKHRAPDSDMSRGRVAERRYSRTSWETAKSGGTTKIPIIEVASTPLKQEFSRPEIQVLTRQMRSQAAQGRGQRRKKKKT
jgi:hypothetical protein